MVTKMQDKGQGFPGWLRTVGALWAVGLLLTGTSVTPVAAGALIRGKLEDTAGKPLPGAIVHAYHLVSETPYQSEPTNKKGQFQLPELPYGYYDVAIETPQGLYPADRVADLQPGGKTTVTLTVREFTVAEAAVQDDFRAFPGVEVQPVGIVALKKKATGKEFWKSPKGIAIIGGIGGAALLAIAISGKSEDPASPAAP